MQEVITFPTSPYHRYGSPQACYTDFSQITHGGLSQGCHTYTGLNENTLSDLPQACYHDFGENRHNGGFSQAYHNSGRSTDNTHGSGLSQACYTHFNEASQSGYSQACFADASSASTPFVSAPSSPGRMFGPPGFYFSAPTSPNWAHRMQMHDDNAYMRRDYPSVIPFSWEEKPGTPKRSYDGKSKDDPNSFLCNSDFEFSARFSELDDPSMSPTPMSSAHELFFNGQIRPLRISPRLEPMTARHGTTHEGAFGCQGRAYELNRSAMPCSSSLSAPQSPRSALNCTRGALACGGFSDVFDINRGCPAPSLSAPQSPRSLLKAELSMKDPSPSNKSFNQSLDGVSSSNTAGSAGHRRARSFSPLHMFHREERVPKSALMEEQAVLSRDSSMGEKEQGGEEPSSVQKGFRKWTLKDLLHRRSGGENRSTTSRASSRRSSTSSMESSSRGSGRSEASQNSSSFMEPNMRENCGKTSHGSSKGKASSANRPNRVPSQKSNKGSVSPHELHYMMHKAQAEELRKKTFLPYRQGLLGCLGFTSRSYKAVSTISKTLQSVSG